MLASTSSTMLRLGYRAARVVVTAWFRVPLLLGNLGGDGTSRIDMQLLRKDIRSQKKQLIAANLSLTDTEATKFWPICDQYQAEYTKIGDTKLALIKEYAQNLDTATDEQALDYLKRSEEISESVIQLRKRYVPLVNQVLPGKKTATFFQLERRIEMLLDVEVASLLPPLQSQGQ